ncbi:MAG: SGNH/GDSL hydrolase family protein [Actinophytocola sp.]|uniref:SGNH/GDSL hydrolase family protein n=1 Tax=Actinophytocola sp. TaxID=1872138 RepID=UPI003D6B2E9D
MAQDAVEHAWLEKVAGEMLAEADPPAPPEVSRVTDRDRPARRRRPKHLKPKIARDGYGRPLRSAPAPAAPPAPSSECDGLPDTPRTGHPLGITGKVLLGAALTGVGLGVAPGLAAAEPLPDNGTTTYTPPSRPADVRSMNDRQLGQELGRVSGKDTLREQEVVTEMKVRGMQVLEASPPTPGLLGADRVNGGVLPNATTPPALAPTDVTKPTVKVVVVGDSFTSGEGATSSTYRQVEVPVTGPDGITYQTLQIDPAHQSSTAPTLQALNQIQAANPGANIQVSFVPVSGATRDSLYQTTRQGTPFEQAPQINAVRGADVVIVGIGGNDARFADWVRTSLFNSDSSSAEQFPGFMQQLNDGTYLANQTRLLTDVSNLASPNATVVSLGYPRALPATVPGTPTWWSPFSWSTISQGEAERSNQLADALNRNNQDASTAAAAAHPGQQWIYADVSTALQGRELLTQQEALNGLTPSNVQGSYHPNDLGQQLLGSVLQPYVEQAVNSQLAQRGFQGAENVPPVNPTFAYQWNLRVDVPLQMQNQPTPQQPPTEQPPANQTPAEQAPVNETPAEQPPATEVPADQAPVNEVPAEQPPVNQTPAEQALVNEVPAEQAPVSETPAEQAPVNEVPAEQAPVNETPAEQAPVNEVPAEQAPANETPAEVPADQPPAEVAPTESDRSDLGSGNEFANVDDGSGSFTGDLDTGASRSIAGNTGSDLSPVGSVNSDLGNGFTDTGSFGGNVDPVGFTDTGLGTSGGFNSGGFDSGNTGGFDSGSSGGFDSGSSSGFNSGSSGGFDSGSSGGFDSGSSGGFDSGSSGGFDSGSSGGFDSGGGSFDSGGGGGFDSGGGGSFGGDSGGGF